MEGHQKYVNESTVGGKTKGTRQRPGGHKKLGDTGEGDRVGVGVLG